MVIIERACDKGKDPLLTITKKEILNILKKKDIKGLYNKNKKELCDLFIKLQKKTKRRQVIGKKSKKRKINFSNNLENIKEVKKYKGVAAKPVKNTKTDEEKIMFQYCVPEIFNKYNLWSKEDANEVLEKIDDENTPKEWFEKMKINTDPNELESLKVEIDFCKNFLDSDE